MSTTSAFCLLISISNYNIFSGIIKPCALIEINFSFLEPISLLLVAAIVVILGLRAIECCVSYLGKGVQKNLQRAEIEGKI